MATMTAHTITTMATMMTTMATMMTTMATMMTTIENKTIRRLKLLKTLKVIK